VGPAAPDFSNQVHDFNPGLDNGLFWTIPISANSVEVHPGNGKASMVVDNLVIEDYGNVINALLDGPSDPATVSFEVHWAPGTNRLVVRDPAFGVAGQFVQNTATMVWSATSAGKRYQSGSENTSFSVFGQVGHERNGVFYPQG
jgi:hypothetical protein